MAKNQKNANYDKLKSVLKEVFQLDQADLDFGIYRIMNQKRDEITDFLDNRLLPQVKEILYSNSDGNNTKAQQELNKAIEQANELGVDPETLPKVVELRSNLSSSSSVDSLEEEVYSHLANFFKRYYKEGDFVSLRRYKKDVYAIPYEGEEVKLYWANHDQYYIKSSEYLKNYGFKLPNGKSVKFELKEASTEQNNNKEQSGKERRFQLFSELPLEVLDDENTLIINFIYEEYDKKIKQDKLNTEAIEALSSNIPKDFLSILEKKPTEKNKNRTLLEKHITDFTARNSFDYFIHKDLEGFLTRELDFYIKNEVLYLDDINTKSQLEFTSQLSKVNAIKQVAQKIITFLSQLENFQKKLWLKKKFVVSTNYCITLDRIPEKYYEEICENHEQLEEWKKLFSIHDVKEDLLSAAYSEPLSVDFLKSQPFLMIDTRFFSDEFNNRLLSEYDDLDNQINGILINSDNFQALNLIGDKLKGKVKVNYIDPPYNAQSSEILYKNSFKHSSWLSLMQNRINISKKLLHDDFVYIVAIDEVEQEVLGQLLSIEFSNHEKSCISIVHNATGQQGTNFSYTHEFAYFIFPKGGQRIGLENRDDNPDVRPLRNVSKGSHLRTDAANCFYPIYIKNEELIGFGDVCDDEFHPEGINIHREDGVIEVYPIDPQGVERKWVFARNTVESIKDELVPKYDKKKDQWDIIRTKTRFNYKTVWTGSKYSANSYGSRLLNEMLPTNKFTYPKSIHTVINCIDAGLNNSKNGMVIDYFAGSGTTGEAVVKLNKKDDGDRKVTLIEMGEYFETVTKPRMQKSIYADSYKNGFASDKNGISYIFKYHDLESYEDCLNNLNLEITTNQSNLVASGAIKEEFILNYMLDFESKKSLLNIEIFKNPFNYKLNVTRNNETQETTIDLVETFNYLIGLHLKTVQTIKGFKVITGITNERNEETLIIWRNTEEKSNQDLNEFFTKMEFSTRDSEFQRIYVNGDNHLENLKTDDDNWKVVLIEEEFMKRMFDVQDI